MFHSAARLLTLISVLFHAGMGCCAHHDHCWTVRTAEAPVDETAEAHQGLTCSCAHHHDDEQSSDDNDSKSGNESCPCGHNHSDCTDYCAWLTASKVKVPSDQNIVLPEAMTVSGLSNIPALSVTTSLIGKSLLTSHPGDSLHAATQVWRL
jgi:hypothetical protein